MTNYILVRILSIYSLVAFFFYIGVAAVRTFTYVEIMETLPVVETEPINKYGAYLAVYLANDKASTILTSILLVVFVLCYLFTLLTICHTRKHMRKLDGSDKKRI